MTQTIEDIIACFRREGWCIQKARESYWLLQPPGLFSYKMFLLIYNPFTNKFQIVKPLNRDRHYDMAVKILSGDSRHLGKGARLSKGFSSELLSIIKVPDMFFIKVGNCWINLAAIRTLTVTSPTAFNNTLTVSIRWNNNYDDDESAYEYFEGDKAQEFVDQWEKVCKINC
ncbi:hypothetical protein [Microseira sp. BLCC-F43]|jgi:hypothetical protein|uniref:hypothetical protein n=1 Tax=Microseira sp. BLCC-F43 TaxID=3153602 RepID=UPI0035B71D68